MKLRSCNNMHFIQTIKHGSVQKIPNVDSIGNPALVFKDMKDIPSKQDDHAGSTDGISDYAAKGKTECLPLAERITKAFDHNNVSYTPKDDDQDCDSDDLYIGSETLKQMKGRCRKKKKKGACFVYLVPKQEQNETQVGEDNDLEESLSILKSKLSKNRKGKRKRPDRSVSDVHIVVSNKSEETSSEMDYQLGDACVPSEVKIEDSETELSQCCNIFHNIEHCFNGDDTNKECALTELEYQTWVLSRGYLQTCTLNAEPLFILPPSIGENVEFVEVGETQPQLYLLPAPEDVDEESYDGYPVGHESFSKDRPYLEDQRVDMLNKFHNDAFSGQIDDISGDQVQDMVFDANETEDNNGINILNGFTLENKTNSTSYSEAVLLSTEMTPDIAYKLPEDPEFSIEANAEISHPKPENSILLTVSDGEQSLCSPSADAEKSYLEENHQMRAPFELSPPRMKASGISEMDHPPERLLSTRKVISPSSQEKLQKAMKGMEFTEELDEYRCKEKLYFRNRQKNETLPGKVGFPGNSNEERECKRKGNKITISSKQIYKKHCKDWKGSQPNSNQKISQNFHSPSGLSTGPTSMQSWSESAVKFSQRQMQDMDCLAKKLMQELKSMKDIVEGSLNSEATHATASQMNTDEVKTAIKSATKIEERTKKWLSIMARDCNRFCKIMEKLHDKKELSPESVTVKKRKIVFADEAGGVLCHVKVLENDM
ncbi:uncharacterized protein LOC124932676 [Impatiens glandulifera]|uniref:uncharacterized protein LOC124932676 n=1 Tax=Impatiens glandulifera TaxID=253017 RepID=UPI001FB052BF|nr:uncharacterized protein LOC124932676 [Impatiens glandulifera]